ncbi:hypothetical protein SARC_10583 [Sphaeroforma arctica JP610]|uniref:Vacuolar import/degradation Vid27 C-terminal domain-containing protein n=1 Tax=Sphaeroforma arctica JP610 TaxID=667725 RepID=A0A0L0FJK0_9EUKA|nr:hypothetical protein SARC_10583 [Sphaeroforma arctica JP610]KNC76940.1 hypothetical protein SARC_10583 [Sphaeroforma arctica JP610]|eukprot:XP_014150842.1 hypothetical protein SARC_10583 [Sphaeroforma arctica JP610]
MLATDYVHLPLTAVAQIHVDETKEHVAIRIGEHKHEHVERLPLASSYVQAVSAEEAGESGRAYERTLSPQSSVYSSYNTNTSQASQESYTSAQESALASSSPTRTSGYRAAYPSAHEPAAPASSSYKPLHTPSRAPASTPARASPKAETPVAHAYIAPVYKPLGVYRAEGVSVYDCEGALFAFDAGIQKFVPVVGQAHNVISSLSKNRLRLDVYKGSELWYRQVPSMKMNLYPLKSEQMIVWNGSREGVECSFGWKFAKAIDFRNWQYKIYGAFLAQHSAEAAKKMDQESRDYVMALGGFDPMDIDKPEVAGALSDSDETSDTDDLLNDSFWYNNGEKNTGLAVGFNTNRSFVKNRSGINVLRTTDEGDMETVTSIGSKQFKFNGKTFNANNMMLHKGDQQMLLFDPIADDKAIYRMDMTRGEVVEEWKTHDDIGVNVLAPSKKYAQKTDADTLVGLNQNRLMVVDGRLSGSKVVESQSQAYKTAPLLSCLHTTADGGVVVGSELGEIRMFDRVGIRAKTLLPGFGEAIIGIDVSADGKYILATCENYLLFIPTTFTDPKSGNEATGIKKQMGKHKPKPTVLKLRPDHVQLMNSTVDFTPARFNIGDSKEELISASSGQYVVQWNVSEVANGITDHYVIKKYKDSVIGDMFVYNQPDKVVVALTSDVTTSKKQMFKKPQTVFNKGRGNVSARDSIVHTLW